MENKPAPEQGDKKECCDSKESCGSKGCGCMGGRCCYVAAVLGLIALFLIGGTLGYLLGRCGGRKCGPMGMGAHKMCCDKPGMGHMGAMGMGGMGAECPMMGDAAGAPAAEKSEKK